MRVETKERVESHVINEIELLTNINVVSDVSDWGRLMVKGLEVTTTFQH